MDFVEFAKQKERMCENVKSCDFCQFGSFICSSDDLNYITICNSYCMEEPEHAEKILQKWLAENPFLDKCPLCGSDASFYYEINKYDNNLRNYGVMCEEHGCATISAIYETKAIAAEKWNKRAV